MYLRPFSIFTSGKLIDIERRMTCSKPTINNLERRMIKTENGLISIEQFSYIAKSKNMYE